MPTKRPLRASTRFSKHTPDGLRLRVLDAIPEWERIPRVFRQALAMMPIYGSYGAACEELKIDSSTNNKVADEIAKVWTRTGRYPSYTRTRIRRKRGEKRKEVTETFYLTNSEIMQQLANEMSGLALIQAEKKMSAAQAMKMAVDAGWFLNLEAEVEKERAYTDQRISESMQRRAEKSVQERNPSTEAEDDVPIFEQEFEVDDDFIGDTAAAQEDLDEDDADDGAIDGRLTATG